MLYFYSFLTVEVIEVFIGQIHRGGEAKLTKKILTASLIKPDKMKNGSSRLLNISNSYTYPYIHCALPETSTALWILLIYVDDIDGKDND